MKKLLILAAMAGVALVSCVKNEPAPSVTDQHEITFAPPVVGVNTKTVTLVTNDNISGSFGVFGYYHPETYSTINASGTYLYMDNVHVSRQTYTIESTDYPTWTTTSVNDYYWPKTGKMTFAAYYPAHTNTDAVDDFNVAHTGNGIQFENYEVGDDANVDLMFSERSYNQTKDDEKLQTNPQFYGVQLNFKHALSAVRFKFKAASNLVDDGGPKYTFKIKNVTVQNVHSKGTFNQSLTDGASAETPVASATDWTTSVERAYTAYDNTTGFDVNPTTLEDDSYETSASDPEVNLILLLLPQALNHAGENNVTIQVTYDLRHHLMAENEWITGNVVNAELATGSLSQWLRGNIYTYNLTLDLDKIEFAPSVTGWDEYSTAQEVTVDNQVTNP